MLKWLKADLRKHWASWIGFSGFVVIGIPLFLCLGDTASGISYIRAQQLELALICWLFCCIGLFWEAQIERSGGYISDEKRSKPYR